MNIRMQIRKYNSSDFAACRNLWVELTQKHRDIYEDQTIGGDNPEKIFDTYIEKENLYGPWIGLFDGQIIGFTGLLVEGEEADIEPVIISKIYRDQGYGKELVSHAINEAKKLNIRFLNVIQRHVLFLNISQQILFISISNEFKWTCLYLK